MVCLSVCLLVTFVSLANTAEPVEMLVCVGDSDGPKKPCIRWAQYPLSGMGNFGGSLAH